MQREARFTEHAEDALRNHVILNAPDPAELLPRWQIGSRDGRSMYRAEIIATYRRGLIVHGDLDIVNFESYSGQEGAIAVVNWIADSDIHYATSKAAWGTGTDVCYGYDSGVALDRKWASPCLAWQAGVSDLGVSGSRCIVEGFRLERLQRR